MIRVLNHPKVLSHPKVLNHQKFIDKPQLIRDFNPPIGNSKEKAIQAFDSVLSGTQFSIG